MVSNDETQLKNIQKGQMNIQTLLQINVSSSFLQIYFISSSLNSSGLTSDAKGCKMPRRVKSRMRLEYLNNIPRDSDFQHDKNGTFVVFISRKTEIGAEDERGKNIQSETDDLGIFFQFQGTLKISLSSQFYLRFPSLRLVTYAAEASQFQCSGDPDPRMMIFYFSRDILAH